MPITYSNTLRNLEASSKITVIDAGSGPGTLEILAGTTVLATYTLAKPSGTVTNGVYTLAGLPQTVPVTAAGTANLARIKDSTGTIHVDGLTVGTSGANINFNTTALVLNQNLTLNSLTFTEA